MSWFVQIELTWFQRFCINILKAGPIPKHLAIIMDGNRRFARKSNRGGKFGHNNGFDKLTETLQWCLELEITEVTVYAFSIENFKRTSEEVESLMKLIRKKYGQLLKDKDKLMSEGVCIRALGNLSLLPADIRQLLAEVMLMTKDNNKLYFNVAIAYTSRDEIINAISTIADGVRSKSIQEDDIDEHLLSRCMYTNKSREPDILIRTSGETRFSDFLLWQIEFSSIWFTDILWPEFCIWHLLTAVFMYQQNRFSKKPQRVLQSSDRSQEFLESVETSRWTVLQEYADVNR